MSVIAALKSLEMLVHDVAPTDDALAAYQRDLNTIRKALSGDHARAYVEATEWNLATLSGFLLRKSTPKNEIARQTKICLDMLGLSLGMPDETYRKFPRVQEILADAKDGLDAALKRWIAKHHS